MSGGKNRLLGVLRALPAALVLLTGAAVIAAERDERLAHRLEAVVHIHAEVPPEARTAGYLGTARDGSGVVIDDAGLIVTIGYLITEAMGAEIRTADGKISRADVVGLDLVSGLGLLRAAEVLPVKPMPIGTAQELAEKTPVVVAGSGGIEAAQPAVVVSRRAFAGYWEYLLDDAIFTAPPHPAWSGAALLAPDGRLAGIGSLIVGDAKAGLPGNMFVPIDHLRPVMGDLLALGRPSIPPRPWLGVNRGDLVTALDGTPVHDLADFYRTLWQRGEAGIAVRLSLARQGEERDVEVRTIDRYRYLRLETTY